MHGSKACQQAVTRIGRLSKMREYSGVMLECGVIRELLMSHDDDFSAAARGRLRKLHDVIEMVTAQSF